MDRCTWGGKRAKYQIHTGELYTVELLRVSRFMYPTIIPSLKGMHKVRVGRFVC
jgi:hypothetical protein